MVDTLSCGADDNDGTDGNATIPSAALEALIAALTSAFSTAMTVAVAASSGAGPPAPPTARTISTAINPYDTESLDLDSKEGKYHWKMVTSKEEGWKLLALTTDNSEALANLYNNCTG